MDMYPPGTRRRRQGHAGFASMFLAVRLAQEYVPPVTTGLVAVNALVYFNPAIGVGIDFGWAQDACLNGPAIIENLQLLRIWTSALFHLSEMHLYYNMTSLVLKGRLLEDKLGGERFAGTVIMLATLQGLVYIAVVWVLMVAFDEPAPYHQCAAGFSGVLFALKVLVHKMGLTDHNAPVWFLAFELHVSSKWVYWVELVAIQLIVPHVSFVGHLSGILAGLLFWHGADVAATAAEFINPLKKKRYADSSAQLGGPGPRPQGQPQRRPAVPTPTAPPSPAAWQQPSDSDSDGGVEATGEQGLPGELGPSETSAPPPAEPELGPEKCAEELRRARLARFDRRPHDRARSRQKTSAPMGRTHATVSPTPPRFRGNGRLGGN